MSSCPKVFLIDTHGLCYRAFYAVRGLSNSKGQPTNAVLGFCNILRKLISDLKPKYIAACFDAGKKTHRQEKFAGYKIKRQAMPDDLASQIQIIRDLLSAYQIPIFEVDGFEADDIMATLTRTYIAQGLDVVLVTDDKDMAQLVGEHVQVYSARNAALLDAQGIAAKFGVRPDQIVDYLALAGDATDNIPGVPGIGEVGAKKLLAEFGSLAKIYKNLDKVGPEKVREKLRLGNESALMSQELATLHAQVPLQVRLEDMAVKAPDAPRLLKIFEDLEFRKFAEGIKIQEEPELPASIKNPMSVSRGKDTVTVVYDAKLLRKEGTSLKGDIFDVYLAGYLLGGGHYKNDIASLAWQYLNTKPHENVLKDLYLPMSKALTEQGMDNLMYGIELPLVDVLLRMEENGVGMDLAVLSKLGKECEDKLKNLEESLHKLAGTPFNINSPKQLSEVLFQRLKLPVIKKTKTGLSTDEEVLTRLADKHPLPAQILECRQLSKLKNTYLDALPRLVKPGTGRIHATFNQTGAETGRLSSNNPNLQNIPVRTELGRRIRAAFIPYAKDHVLLAADYSQIELRILAHLSKDAGLTKAFAAGEDIHRFTASLMFDVAESKVDEQMRYAAKRINFGIVYGMSAFGLSKDLNIPPREAQDFIDRYFLRYPGVQAYLDGEIRLAKERGYAMTMFNRRRYLPDINNRNAGLRQFAERQAINAPIQGSAADLIKKTMVQIDAQLCLKKLNSTMILSVHDELVFDVPKSEQSVVAGLVKTHMESVITLSVPVVATVKTGPNWLEMKEL